MKTLHLNLKFIWYDKIASGEKTSEYRACSPYWNHRFAGFNNLKTFVIFYLYRHFLFPCFPCLGRYPEYKWLKKMSETIKLKDSSNDR